METVNFSVKYVEKASRLELLIRFFWAIPSYIVLMFLAIIYGIAACIQFFYILVLGKRSQTLHNLIVMFLKYYVPLASYMNLLTDERNPIMPQ